MKHSSQIYTTQTAYYLIDNDYDRFLNKTCILSLFAEHIVGDCKSKRNTT